MNPACIRFKGTSEDARITGILRQLRKDVHPMIAKEHPHLHGEALEWQVDEFLLNDIAKTKNPVLKDYEAENLINKLFNEGAYRGPKPAIEFSPFSEEWEGGYSPELNQFRFGPTVRLSQIYHELGHYEGALDIAVACAHYRQLPLYKKVFTRPPKIRVAETLEQYVVTHGRHRDLGWVQLGYDTASDMAQSRVDSQKYRLTGRDEDFRAYSQNREELIANLTGMSKIGKPAYGLYLKMRAQEKRQEVGLKGTQAGS